MPTAIPNGGGEDDPTTSEAAAYNAAISVPPGDRTAQEQATIEDYEAKVQTVGNGKVDSGGTGGRQAAVALEVGRTIAKLENDRKKSIRQWAQKAASGGPNARKAQEEMHGSDTATMANLLFLLYELRDRLNSSPY